MENSLFPVWLQALGWGLLSAAGLLLGAALSYFMELPHRVISAVVGFGGGVLVAVLSLELMEEAHHYGGFSSTIATCFAGAFLFCAANWYLSQHGGKHRKRCGDCVQQPTEEAHKGSGLAIAVGALVDGIPESIILGVSLVGGGSIAIPVIVGYTAFGHSSQPVIGGVMAFAGGAILAMLAETMIPEAFEDAQSFIGFITVTGFLCAFALHKLST